MILRSRVMAARGRERLAQSERRGTALALAGRRVGERRLNVDRNICQNSRGSNELRQRLQQDGGHLNGSGRNGGGLRAVVAGTGRKVAAGLAIGFERDSRSGQCGKVGSHARSLMAGGARRPVVTQIHLAAGFNLSQNQCSEQCERVQ